MRPCCDFSGFGRLSNRQREITSLGRQEFYQLLNYKDDVDLEAKLDEWERFYNFHRPHEAFNGNTPYEALREKL